MHCHDKEARKNTSLARGGLPDGWEMPLITLLTGSWISLQEGGRTRDSVRWGCRRTRALKWTSETQDPHGKPREAGRGRTLQIEKHMGRMKEEETKETNLEE